MGAHHFQDSPAITNAKILSLLSSGSGGGVEGMGGVGGRCYRGGGGGCRYHGN